MPKYIEKFLDNGIRLLLNGDGAGFLEAYYDYVEKIYNLQIPLKDIAERQQISKKYLEIIVKDLVKSGMVYGVSGKGGGYVLCRKPEDYSVGEILEVMEGTLAPVACLENNAGECLLAPECHTLPMWKEYYDLIHGFFYSKKLSDLL